jgi:hypothetical protein
MRTVFLGSAKAYFSGWVCSGENGAALKADDKTFYAPSLRDMVIFGILIFLRSANDSIRQRTND